MTMAWSMLLSVPSLLLLTGEAATKCVCQVLAKSMQGGTGSFTLPSIRIYYLLTHKPHKGLSPFYFRRKLKEEAASGQGFELFSFHCFKAILFSRLEPTAQGADFCPIKQPSHLGRTGAFWGREPSSREAHQRENAHFPASNSKTLISPRADASQNSPKNKPRTWS